MKLLPNFLSAARLLIAPYFFWLLWTRQYPIALALGLFAGLTDALDGLLARRFGASSRVGAYLDPVADKILLSGSFLTLALAGAIEPWLAFLILGRDVLILLFVGFAFILTSRRDFPPSIWGKLSTAAQIALILTFLTYSAHLTGPILFEFFKWTAAVLTAWSALHYAWLGRSMMKR